MQERLKGLKKKVSYFIPVSAIEEDPELPRKFFKEEKLRDMGASIKEKGIKHSLIVRPKKDDPNKYKIIMGKVRFRGALRADCAEVPCEIEDVSDKEALELALIENMHRDDLTPFEEGWGMLKLIKDYGYSVSEMCKKLSKSEDFVRTRLKLLSLPEAIQRYVAQGDLGMEHAVTLVRLDSPKKQIDLAEGIIRESLSRDQAKQKVSEIIEETEKKVIARQKKITSGRIGVQARILRKLLNNLNCEELSFGQREEIKGSLLELKGDLERIIQEVESID